MTDLLWKLDGVTMSGSNRPRLSQLSVEIRSGVTAVVGQSGAGKTSLLNLLCGFERPDAGTIETSFDSAKEKRLPLFWVPQNDGLWPHMTVVEHLAAVRGVHRKCETAGDELLAEFDFRGKEHARPSELSQGERSRLSVARAIASGARVLVMDEPLSHVNPSRVGKYWDAIRRRCRETNTSLVIATHSPETVLTMAERVLCMSNGCVVCEGPVEEIYYRPANLEQAEFLGPANWLSREEATEWLNGSAKGVGCYRPEQIVVERQENGPCIVESSRFAGSIAELSVRHAQTGERRRFFHRPSADGLTSGTRVSLKALLMMLLCFMVSGCVEKEAPRLPVSEVNYRSMPAEGPKIPAPRSMTCGPNDELYVLDNAARVLVYSKDGELMRQWKMPDSAKGNPEGVCVFRDGRVGVADTHYSRVVFFDSSGKVLGMLGKQGTGPSEFLYPVSITQDPDGNFYVGEYGSNDRVQKFAEDGKFLLQIGSSGTGPGELQRASGVIWHDGKIYVADAFNNRIQVFRDTGEFERVLVESTPEHSLEYPYDLALCRQREIVVIEYQAARVSKYDLAGRLLGRFGTRGRGEGEFSTPWGVAAASDGVIYVADTGNRRIVELKP